MLFLLKLALMVLFLTVLSPQTMLTAISMSAIATNGVVPGKTLWYSDIDINFNEGCIINGEEMK